MQCGYIVHWSKMRCKVKPPEENSLRTAKGDISSWTISAITRQSIELERCSNHLQIRQQSTASFDWKTIFQFWFWGSLWVTSQMGMFLRFFGWVYLARESNPQCHCLTQSCFGIYDSIRVFRALNWLSNISGAKIKAQKILHPGPWLAITPQSIELVSCSNPRKTREVLYFAIKKLLKISMAGFLLMFIWSRHVHAYFVYIPMRPSFPGSRSNESVSWLKVFWILGYNTSL